VAVDGGVTFMGNCTVVVARHVPGGAVFLHWRHLCRGFPVALGDNIDYHRSIYVDHVHLFTPRIHGTGRSSNLHRSNDSVKDERNVERDPRIRGATRDGCSLVRVR